MIKQVSTRDIDNLVGHLISEKFLHEHYKDDVFRLICDFLEKRVGITIEKVFTGKAHLEFDFSVMSMGNSDDVKELVCQEVLEALHSIRYFRLLNYKNLYFKDIQSKYISKEESQ